MKTKTTATMGRISLSDGIFIITFNLRSRLLQRMGSVLKWFVFDNFSASLGPTKLITRCSRLDFSPSGNYFIGVSPYNENPIENTNNMTEGVIFSPCFVNNKTLIISKATLALPLTLTVHSIIWAKSRVGVLSMSKNKSPHSIVGAL